MIFIHCPYCGERNEDEFVYGGDVKHPRPADPASMSDAEWCDYIYTVPNTKGWANEFWWHVRGCQRWITVQRNSANNALRTVQPEQDDG